MFAAMMGRLAGWVDAAKACAINSVTIDSTGVGCVWGRWLHAGPLRWHGKHVVILLTLAGSSLFFITAISMLQPLWEPLNLAGKRNMTRQFLGIDPAPTPTKGPCTHNEIFFKYPIPTQRPLNIVLQNITGEHIRAWTSICITHTQLHSYGTGTHKAINYF